MEKQYYGERKTSRNPEKVAPITQTPSLTPEHNIEPGPKLENGYLEFTLDKIKTIQTRRLVVK